MGEASSRRRLEPKQTTLLYRGPELAWLEAPHLCRSARILPGMGPESGGIGELAIAVHIVPAREMADGAIHHISHLRFDI